MENAIEIKNLTKKFRLIEEGGMLRKVANLTKKNAKIIFPLRNFSLSIKKGEALGIIGRNGAGKTTLLKLISGVYVPTSGKIRIKGKIGTFIELGIGFHPDLTVKENVFLYAALRGILKSEIAEKFHEIIGFAGIESFENIQIKKLSSGMRSRLAFATAININADILLLDEVLAVGDKEFYKKCLFVMNNFKKSGKTILFVSHDLNAVKMFCTKALYLRKDNSYVIGKPEKVVKVYLKEK